jgi:hypothetical protein
VSHPDLLGDDERRGMVARVLEGVQRQLFSLEVRAVAEGWVDEATFYEDDGKQLAFPGEERPMLVGERRQQLKDAEARLVDAYQELFGTVDE